MYTYLLSNGQDYSDYGIVAVVQSEEQIDWPAVKRAIVAAMPPPDGNDMGWEKINDALAWLNSIPGVRLLEYEELQFDLRHTWHEPLMWELL